MRDVLVKENWFEGLEGASQELLDQIFIRIMRYGCFGQEIKTENDDPFLKYAWNQVKGHIDRMTNKHDELVEKGKVNGKKMVGDPQQIYDYCQLNPKAKVNDVGEALGLLRTNAGKGPYAYLYDNPGWKNRKAKGWKFSDENPEQNSEIGKNIPNSESESEKNSESIAKWDF